MLHGAGIFTYMTGWFWTRANVGIHIPAPWFAYGYDEWYAMSLCGFAMLFQLNPGWCCDNVIVNTPAPWSIWDNVCTLFLDGPPKCNGKTTHVNWSSEEKWGAPPLKTAMVTTKTSMDVHLGNRNCYYNMLKPIITHMYIYMIYIYDIYICHESKWFLRRVSTHDSCWCTFKSVIEPLHPSMCSY